MADFKDFVAVGAVLVSAGSAFFAYNANLRSTEANQQANAMRAELDSSKFTADTSIRLLEMTYKTFAEADTPTEVFGACQYASSLAEVETKAMPGQNSLIQGFLDRVAARGRYPVELQAAGQRDAQRPRCNHRRRCGFGDAVTDPVAGTGTGASPRACASPRPRAGAWTHPRAGARTDAGARARADAGARAGAGRRSGPARRSR
jgi:hypothetical protein